MEPETEAQRTAPNSVPGCAAEVGSQQAWEGKRGVHQEGVSGPRAACGSQMVPVFWCLQLVEGRKGGPWWGVGGTCQPAHALSLLWGIPSTIEDASLLGASQLEPEEHALCP